MLPSHESSPVNKSQYSIRLNGHQGSFSVTNGAFQPSVIEADQEWKGDKLELTIYIDDKALDQEPLRLGQFGNTRVNGTGILPFLIGYLIKQGVPVDKMQVFNTPGKIQDMRSHMAALQK